MLRGRLSAGASRISIEHLISHSLRYTIVCPRTLSITDIENTRTELKITQLFI